MLVSGYAEALVADTRLQNAKITWLEKQESFHTNQYGQFSFCAKPHEKMTLFIQKTSAFSSEDGGVLIFNLPASRVWYRISAVKPGLKFTSAHFWCRPNTFINVSPPHSPSVIKPLSLRNN